MDLISREDAIRWVKTECNPYGKPTLDFESGKKVIEHLEQMPSAQPERTETHACDLIDRQAAIESVADEIWHYPNECYKNLNVFENAKDLAEHALRGLPSAEPERKKGNEKCSNELPCGWCSLFDTPCFGRGGEQDG
jgi:hypothetical protein